MHVEHISTAGKPGGLGMSPKIANAREGHAAWFASVYFPNGIAIGFSVFRLHDNVLNTDRPMRQ